MTLDLSGERTEKRHGDAEERKKKRRPIRASRSSPGDAHWSTKISTATEKKARARVKSRLPSATLFRVLHPPCSHSSHHTIARVPVSGTVDSRQPPCVLAPPHPRRVTLLVPLQMLAALFGSASPAPRVEISIARELVVIPPTPDGDLTSTPSLSGVVTVLLPTPQRADRLFVTLEGKVELYGACFPGCGTSAHRMLTFRRSFRLGVGREERDLAKKSG